jgi:hypothetical protein
MADRGAGKFIASLPDIPANHSAQRESDAGRKTRATYGRTSSESFAKSSPAKFSSKTWTPIYLTDSTKSRAAYERWAMQSKRESLARRKSARLIAESDCSHWHTPHGMSSKDHTGKMGAGGEFAKQAKNWQTPSAADEESRGVPKQGKQLMLDAQAKQWPTPKTPNGGQTTNGAAGKKTKLQLSLAVAARLWPTAKAVTGGANSNRIERKQRTRTGGADLQEEARQFPTPAHRDYRHPNAKPGADRGRGSTGEQLPNFIAHRFHLDRTSSTNGRKYSASLPALNPLFVEWLMGIPHAWTDSAPLETALYQSWRRTHTELLQRLIERDAA